MTVIPVRYFTSNAGVVGGPTVRRCGCKFEIPARFVESFGHIDKKVMELIRNATKESLLELERLGVKCTFDTECEAV